MVGAGATPYGLAAVETIRIESGAIFIGRDYFQHETSPYDVGLDNLIRVGKAELLRQGRARSRGGEPAEPVRHARRRRTRFPGTARPSRRTASRSAR